MVTPRLWNCAAGRGGWRREPEPTSQRRAGQTQGLTTDAKSRGKSPKSFQERMTSSFQLRSRMVRKETGVGAESYSRVLTKDGEAGAGGQMWGRVHGEAWMWGCEKGGAQETERRKSRDLPASSGSWWLSQGCDQTGVFPPVLETRPHPIEIQADGNQTFWNREAQTWHPQPVCDG